MQRVTNSVLVSNLIRSLNERMNALSQYQNEMATGKKVFYASDDPNAAGLILKIRNNLSQNDQYQENLSSGISWLMETESNLQELNDILSTTRAKAVEGSNSALSPDGMAQLAEEVNGYLENIFSLSNADFTGKTLFGGTNTDESAFEAVRDADSDWIISMTENINGTDGSIRRQINSNESIQINIKGSDLFQPDGSSGNDDIFNVLILLRDALQAGDATAVGDTISLLDDVMSNVSDFTTLAGTKVGRLTQMQEHLLQKETNLTSALSYQEDADLVETATQMALGENAYQVALQVGAQIIQPSLINFI